MPYDRSKFVTRTAQEDIAFDFMVDAKDYIADALFTPKPVGKSDTFVYQYDTSKLRLIETKKKTNSEVDLVDEQMFKRNITLEEHKLGAEVNPKDVRDADIGSMVDEARKVKLVTNHLLIAREKLAVDIATTVANYPADLTAALAAGSRWGDAGGDPERDKVTADNALKNRCGMVADAMAIDGDTYRKLRLSPSFRDRIKYTNGGPVSEEAIKAFFNVKYLFIGDAKRDVAVEGAAAASIGGFWGSNAIFFCYNPSADLEHCSYGHMFLLESPFWTKTTVDERRNGPAGSMKRVEVGTEYILDKGFVVSEADNDFAGGYLLRTVVD